MKKVLIVGASSGIGYACAKKFLSQGWSVLALSRTECVLAGVQNYFCDLADETALDETLTTIARENATLDCLIYSAGASMACPLEYVLASDYRYLFEVNFFGFLHCLRRLIPHLRHSLGVACAVGSIASYAPIPFDSYYSASKSALNALCGALQTELAPRGVRVISVLPGGTKTYFTYKRKTYPPDTVGDYVEAMQKSADNLERMEQSGQQPEKVAEVIFKKCTEKTFSYLFFSGLKNKTIALILRLIPQKLLTELTKIVYFTDRS